MPHYLYVGTLTDLLGCFPSKGAVEGGFFLISLFDDCLHGWLLNRLFIISVVVVRCLVRFFHHPFFFFWISDLSLAHQCPILRVTSTSPRAHWLFIRVQLMGPLLWLLRAMRTWRGLPLAQPSVLTLDRLLSPPRLAQAFRVRCRTPPIQRRDSHHTW